MITIVVFHGAGSLTTSSMVEARLANQAKQARHCTLHRKMSGFGAGGNRYATDTRQLSSHFVYDVSACRDPSNVSSFRGSRHGKRNMKPADSGREREAVRTILANNVS